MRESLIRLMNGSLPKTVRESILWSKASRRIHRLYEFHKNHKKVRQVSYPLLLYKNTKPSMKIRTIRLHLTRKRIFKKSIKRLIKQIKSLKTNINGAQKRTNAHQKLIKISKEIVNITALIMKKIKSKIPHLFSRENQTKINIKQQKKKQKDINRR